jgi:hypothetical protein
MAQGRKNLGKIQLGRETTPGMPVAATTIWRGAASSIEDQRLVKLVEEMVGYLNIKDRSYIPELLAGIKLADTEATFEQFPHLLVAGWGVSPTGVQDGSGSDYIYTATIPTTSTPSMTGRTLTVRGGDDHEAEIVEYVFCSEWSLKGAIREAVKMSGTLMGRQVQPSSFTGALSLPAVEELLAQKAKIYLDAIGGAFGSTQVASTVVGFELTVKTGVVVQFTLDGTLYFTKLLQGDPEISGKLSFLHDSGADGAAGVKLDWRNETPKLLQIKVEGSALQMAGTTYSNKTLLVDLPIYWTKVGALEYKDAATLVNAEFVSGYNATADTAGDIIVVNELAILP